MFEQQPKQSTYMEVKMEYFKIYNFFARLFIFSLDLYKKHNLLQWQND